MVHQLKYSREEGRLAQFLKFFAFLLMTSSFITLLIPILWPSTPLFVSSPFLVSNTVAGLALLGFLSWFAAADVRRLRTMIYVLIGGLLIGAIASLGLYLSPIGQKAALLVSFAACGAAALLLARLVSTAKIVQGAWQPWIPDHPLTRWEHVAQAIFLLFGLAALGAAFGSVLVAFLNPEFAKGVLINPLMMVGSCIKVGVLGLLALLVGLDLRRYVHTVQLLTLQIIGNSVSLIVIIVFALFGFARFGVSSLVIGGTILAIEQVMLAACLLDAGVIAGFVLLNRQINLLFRDNLHFLNLWEFRALEAIAETLITGGEAEILLPYQVALRTDQYLSSFHSHRLRLARWAIIGLQLWPLLYLMPPITYLSPGERQRFIERHFKQEIVRGAWGYRLLDRLLRGVNSLLLPLRGRSPKEAQATLSFTGLVEGMLRFNMQLTYMGYYSNSVVWPKTDDGKGIGYVPFSQRPKTFEAKMIRHHPPLQVMTPEIIEKQGIETISDADVVIIGSGAAGSILAEQLLAKGRKVLLLEKGLWVDPKDFNEDEIDMVSRLYSDGALQMSQSLRFSVLQGSCVGGSTVVNNAVCFDTPPRVLEAWNSHDPTAIINVDQFNAAQKAVRERMYIHQITAHTRQPLDGGVLNHGDIVISAGVARYFAKKPSNYRYHVVDANIADCLGCGYCNIGCHYGRKLSMLDLVLPGAQEKYGPEKFSILSEAEAVKLVDDGGKITQVIVRIQGKRLLRIIHPKTVIVSAGTIASSWLLMQSGIGRGKLAIGQGICFNMGSPLHALFDRELSSYDGVQIAHYLALEDRPGFVYETWYNPPVAQAMAMPGWLDVHFHNMRNYNRMAAVGILVGTTPSAYVAPALLTAGPDIVYHPSRDDLNTLVEALMTIGEIFFEAGALEVYASTRSYRAYRNRTAISKAKTDLHKLRELIKDDCDILLGTGHPQGGNTLGASPQKGVVGPDFKVFDYHNLYVCDASVFPSATTVNPQLTVMTMAYYASQLIEN